jgi:hypothetical protein
MCPVEKLGLREGDKRNSLEGVSNLLIFTARDAVALIQRALEPESTPLKASTASWRPPEQENRGLEPPSRMRACIIR